MGHSKPHPQVNGPAHSFWIWLGWLAKIKLNVPLLRCLVHLVCSVCQHLLVGRADVRQHLKVYGIDAVGSRAVGGQNVLLGAAGVVPKETNQIKLGFCVAEIRYWSYLSLTVFCHASAFYQHVKCFSVLPTTTRRCAPTWQN